MCADSHLSTILGDVRLVSLDGDAIGAVPDVVDSAAQRHPVGPFVDDVLSSRASMSLEVCPLMPA